MWGHRATRTEKGNRSQLHEPQTQQTPALTVMVCAILVSASGSQDTGALLKMSDTPIFGQRSNK